MSALFTERMLKRIFATCKKRTERTKTFGPLPFILRYQHVEKIRTQRAAPAAQKNAAAHPFAPRMAALGEQ